MKSEVREEEVVDDLAIYNQRHQTQVLTTQALFACKDFAFRLSRPSPNR
jgi:hypothetical protein